MGTPAQDVRIVGRYALYQPIAAGGMATVHLGRLLGPVGFSRTVAIKRLHAQFAADPEFVSMFLDEARLAARIRHPNVVPTLDVVATGGELFLVMEYVPGESIARLARDLRDRKQTIPLRILSAIMAGVLHGLHAAHEAKDERGNPLGIVHRDMSPQNVLVGTDGVARVLDFGVAKAAGRVQTTRDGQLKGKLSYMPPEQLRGGTVNRQSDIYAAGVMLWELISGQRLFMGDNEGVIVTKILGGQVIAPSRALIESGTSQRETLKNNMLRGLEDLDSTVLRALMMDPADRFATAREMALEIERKLPPATGSEVADWVEHVAKEVLASRAAMVAEIESGAMLDDSGEQRAHVQNVLTAKATLGPKEPIVQRNTVPTTPRTPTPPPQPLGTKTLPLVPPESRPVSSPSSISVATGPTQPPPPMQRGALVTIGLIGVMLGSVLLASALAWRYWHTSPAKGLVSTTVSPDPIASEAPTAVAAATANLTEIAEAGPIASTAPAVGSAPAPSATTAKPPKRAGAGAKAAATAAECATPTWFDEQGVKHYKPQCLEMK